ncbi:dimethylmenaquinone methyltransferase [Thermoplasmatales archaeon SW_10_69_26]|nr:MAG: dimethylmenaquinone methyltransferase [Thermoplasmatales archaeon SW_10_69_26]
MPRPTDPRLEDVTSASITDAMDEMFDHNAHVRDMLTPTPGRELFGPAATIRLVPVREDVYDERLHGFKRVFYEALPDPPEGHVLVLDTSGHIDHAIVGGNKATRLEANRLAGLVADGRLRDFDEIADLEISAWCRGSSPKAGSKDLMAVGANVPAVVGTTTIVPGDWIYADAGGTTVIPEDHLDEVLDRAVEIEEEDEAKAHRIRDEDPEEILTEGA